jgi:hypothetical protein
VAEYAEAMAAGAIFPPPVVFHEAGRFWLAEGFHRVASALQAGFAELPCVVRQGGLRDAILHSAGANVAHGLRRTNADKRRAVLMLLEDEEWSQWADREIARRCAVHHELVGRVRAEHLAETPDAPRTVERVGTVYPMKPRGSAKPAEPAPSSPAEPEPLELPPSLEAEPTLPLDTPPSNVIRAGDRFSLVPVADRACAYGTATHRDA